MRHGKNKYLPFSQKNISYRNNQKDTIHEKYPTKCNIYIFNRWPNKCNIIYFKHSASREKKISTFDKSFLNKKQNMYLLDLLDNYEKISHDQKNVNCAACHLVSNRDHRETIESGPLCITDLFQNKSVAYF